MTPARHNADYHPEKRAESAAHVASGHPDSIIPGVSAYGATEMDTANIHTHTEAAGGCAVTATTDATPFTLPVRPNAIPAELRARPQWVV